MSEDESGSSSSESEDLNVTGLVATRQKRRTAGNLYETLRANLDDEELQKELLAEDEEEDAEDYQGSDRGDDDEAMESSSDEEDAGPSKEGAAEELEGEQELKKAERAEQRKKRKAHEARLKLPAWHKRTKRVQLADDVKTEDGGSTTNSAERPRKKSERSNWLPAAADLPTRRSGRALAVANRETIHANLKQSAERSEKQRRLMRDAAVREKASKRAELSQEQRLEKCRRIEKETSKELGRWEREEAERQRLREEALAAKRKRGFDGPIMKTWSGSSLFEDGKLRLKRLEHGSQKLEDIDVELESKKLKLANAAKEETEMAERQANLEASKLASIASVKEVAETKQPPKDTEMTEKPSMENTEDAAHLSKVDKPETGPHPPTAKVDDTETGSHPPTAKIQDTPDQGHEPSTQEPSTAAIEEMPDAKSDDATPSAGNTATFTPQTTADEATPSVATQKTPPPTVVAEPLPPAQAPVSWLSGIHEYAAEPAGESTIQPPKVSTALEPASIMPYTPSAPSLNGAIPSQPQDQASASAPQLHPQVYPTWPPGQQTFALQPPPVITAPPPPPPPPGPPPLREQAQRTLLVLQHFSNLEAAPPVTSKRQKGIVSALEGTPLSNILLPDSHPTFDAEQTRYLTRTLKRKDAQIPPEPPAKPKCAITTWPAKFRDPKTGVEYADLQTYKILQRVVAGGSAWSGFLGAWVGPRVGPMGRAARGVPPGFAGEVVPVTAAASDKQKEGTVKAEAEVK